MQLLCYKNGVLLLAKLKEEVFFYRYVAGFSRFALSGIDDAGE